MTNHRPFDCLAEKANQMIVPNPARLTSAADCRAQVAGLVLAVALVGAAGCATLSPKTAPSTSDRFAAGEATAPQAAPPEADHASKRPDPFLVPAPPMRLVSDRSAAEPQPYVARQFPDTTPQPPPIYSPSNQLPPPTAPPTDYPYPPFGSPGNEILPPGLPTIAPSVREADLIINGYPARTGRVMFGGAVNSDAGVTGQITVDERNFDILRWPSSFQDLFSGTAFRGAGQTLRIEAVPGSVFDRYTINFADPNLFGYLPISMSVSGFLFDRVYDDYEERRGGGRLSFGYRITPDLSISAGFTGQQVTVENPRVLGVPQLDEALGENESYGGEISLQHNTRDSPFQPSQGHFFEFTFKEVFGSFDYARFDTRYSQYFLVGERADGTGKQTISFSTRLGFSGEDTPIYDNYFAGGYATLRGFDFRGANPIVGGVEVGGRFQWLNTLEYMFPITADDAFRGVAFVDFGTVEQDVEIDPDTFRVSPGVGLRVAIPLLGPAPLAFDFGFPVAKAATDEERMFSFYMSSTF